VTWLLDTNVVSELRRPRPEKRVIAFFAATPLAELYLSTVTLAEIQFGIDTLPDPKRKPEFQSWLEGTVRPMFQNRVYEVSGNVLLRWRHLIHQGRKSGQTYPQPDLFLAAKALEHGLTLVTRDTEGIFRNRRAAF
jgi:predicted nucleic acid-binding protein